MQSRTRIFHGCHSVDVGFFLASSLVVSQLQSRHQIQIYGEKGEESSLHISLEQGHMTSCNPVRGVGSPSFIRLIRIYPMVRDGITFPEEKKSEFYLLGQRIELLKVCDECKQQCQISSYPPHFCTLFSKLFFQQIFIKHV